MAAWSERSRRTSGALLASALFAGVLAGWLDARAPGEQAFREAVTEDLGAQFLGEIRPLLEQRCGLCHAGGEAEGGFDLARFSSIEDVQHQGEYWRYLVERVVREDMPPLGPRPPTAAEVAGLTEFTGRALALRFDASLPPDPGRPVLRRLTRAEIQFTLQDLFGLEFDAAEFYPEDASALGFDHLGSAQSWPALATEGALDAARALAARLVHIPEEHRPTRVRLSSRELHPERGGYLARNGDVTAPHRFPAQGRYRISFGAWADQAGHDLAGAGLVLDGRELARFEVAAERGQTPEVHSHEIEVESSGTRSVGVRYLNDYWRPDEPDPRQRDRNLGVAWIEVEGPLDVGPTEFQSQLEQRFGRPSDGEGWKPLAGELGLRIWRRPLEADLLAELGEFAAGQSSFEAGLAGVLEALLASPRFLYRFEFDPPDAPQVRELDGFEFATRLSFLVWSRAPDAELLAAAAEGVLDTRAGRAEALGRLLRDRRSEALALRFAPQWLALGRLEERRAEADPADAALYAAMRRETEKFFDAILREDQPIAELLGGTRSFANDALAAHYGLEGSSLGPADAEGFRPVSLVGSGRRGLLGQGSILTATSELRRTSPVLRGQWILDSLLGEPSPAPPPEIPSLEGPGGDGGGGDLRAQLERHRAATTCAVCHDRTDPLGFALEQFGPRGEVRPDADARTELPGHGPVEGLEDLLGALEGDERFVRTLVERLMVYALGRPLEAADRGEVARIAARLDPEVATLGELLALLIETPAFRKRRTMHGSWPR